LKNYGKFQGIEGEINMRLHALVKVGKSYGKIIKKKPFKIGRKQQMGYLVFFKNGTKQWVFKKDMTLIW
jgi:hypothetical protein